MPTATANSPILQLPQVIGGLDGTEWVPLVKGGTTKRVQMGVAVDSAINVKFPSAIEFVTGANGGTIAPGKAGFLTVPFPCTITSAVFLGNFSGTIVMDIWKTNYTGYPSVGSSLSITAGTPPTITAGVQYQDSNLSGWTTALSSGDILVFNVNSVSGGVSEVTLSLNVSRSFV